MNIGTQLDKLAAFLTKRQLNFNFVERNQQYENSQADIIIGEVKLNFTAERKSELFKVQLGINRKYLNKTPI